MEPTIEKFREIFTEFNTIGNSRVQYYLDLAIGQVGKNAFGDCYEQAVYLLTAHNLTMMDPSRAQNGEKSSEKAGDLAVSYNTTAGKGLDMYLNQSQYGKQFIQLRDSKVVAPMVLDC